MTDASHAVDDQRCERLELLAHAARVAQIQAPEIVLPADRDVILRRMRFHYLDWGNDAARPIVFLHGGGLTAHTFDLVCLSLRDDYRCLALDQRGHGDSEWSPIEDYDVATQAEDVAAFIGTLDLSGLVLVGMSMGGMNAIHYAGDHSDSLAALVLIDVGPDLQPAGTARIRGLMSEAQEFDSLEEIVEHAKRFNPRRDPLLLRRSLLTNLRRTPGGKWRWKWDPRPRIRPRDDTAMAARRALLWQHVDRITCPTLVIRGGQSDVFSPENAKALVHRLRNATLRVVEGAGHTVQGEDPAGLTREIRAFLAGLEI